METTKLEKGVIRQWLDRFLVGTVLGKHLLAYFGMISIDLLYELRQFRPGIACIIFDLIAFSVIMIISATELAFWLPVLHFFAFPAVLFVSISQKLFVPAFEGNTAGGNSSLDNPTQIPPIFSTRSSVSLCCYCTVLAFGIAKIG